MLSRRIIWWKSCRGLMATRAGVSAIDSKPSSQPTRRAISRIGGGRREGVNMDRICKLSPCNAPEIEAGRICRHFLEAVAAAKREDKLCRERVGHERIDSWAGRRFT